MEEIEKKVLPGAGTAEVHPQSLKELDDTDGLVDSKQVDLPRVAIRIAEEFVGRLATVSMYLVLSPQARAEARSVIPDQIDVDATIQLSLVRRVRPNHKNVRLPIALRSTLLGGLEDRDLGPSVEGQPRNRDHRGGQP